MIFKIELIAGAPNVVARAADVHSVGCQGGGGRNDRIADVLSRVGGSNETDQGVGGNRIGRDGLIENAINDKRVVAAVNQRRGGEDDRGAVHSQ